MANLDVNDVELAHRLNTSRQTINSRRKGRVTMSAEDIGELATALNVDVALFFGPPHEAVQWLVDHRREALDSESARGTALPSTLELRRRCPIGLHLPLRDGRVRPPLRAA